MNRRQPICRGTDARGELLWDYELMEWWQIVQLFYKHYAGDFSEQWMRLVLEQKCGLGWDD